MAGDLEAGFAKLQGQDFEYYMQTYSIVLGRNSKKSSVDVDLAGLGGGMNISRQHARIHYDFNIKRFTLQVLGKNGCHVQGTLFHPGTLAVQLASQYLLQIGDTKFYFLLPIRSILRHPSATLPSMPVYPSPTPMHSPLVMPTIAPTPIPLPTTAPVPLPMHLPPNIPGSSSRKRSSAKAPVMISPLGTLSPLMSQNKDMFQQPAAKKSRGQRKHESMEMKPLPWLSHESAPAFMMPGAHTGHGVIFRPVPNVEARRPADSGPEASPVQVEEMEVVSAVATVLSDLCGPEEWMPMPNLHSELVEHYSTRWPPHRVKKFLTADHFDGDRQGMPWADLLALLRKYPEHFVINTRTKGRLTAEFVSLVSLLS